MDAVRGARPMAALKAATTACSAASCSGFPPVPRPTNQRMRILPSDVMPPTCVGSAVISGVGAGVAVLGSAVGLGLAEALQAEAIRAMAAMSAKGRRPRLAVIELPPPSVFRWRVDLAHLVVGCRPSFSASLLPRWSRVGSVGLRGSRAG